MLSHSVSPFDDSPVKLATFNISGDNGSGARISTPLVSVPKNPAKYILFVSSPTTAPRVRLDPSDLSFAIWRLDNPGGRRYGQAA